MRILKTALLAIMALVLMGSLTACTEDETLAVPQSFCGFTQGKGGRDSSDNANDAKLNTILYEGQSVDYQSDEQVGKFIPCVGRNYRIAPKGGDSDQPLLAVNADGVPVKLWVSMYWQPNQLPDPLRAFIGFCQGKYGCGGNSPGDFNQTNENPLAATKGWIAMLNENWRDVLQRISEAPVRGASNAVWQTNDAEQRDAIAAEMSDRWAGEFQKVTGGVQDLVCGGGSTGVGEEFDCKQVYIVVDRVEAQNQQQQDQAADAVAADAQRELDRAQLQADIDLTNAKYGPVDGPRFRYCRDQNAVAPGSCKSFIGANGVQVQVPAA